MVVDGWWQLTEPFAYFKSDETMVQLDISDHGPLLYTWASKYDFSISLSCLCTHDLTIDLLWSSILCLFFPRSSSGRRFANLYECMCIIPPGHCFFYKNTGALLSVVPLGIFFSIYLSGPFLTVVSRQLLFILGLRIFSTTVSLHPVSPSSAVRSRTPHGNRTKAWES